MFVLLTMLAPLDVGFQTSNALSFEAAGKIDRRNYRKETGMYPKSPFDSGFVHVSLVSLRSRL